MMQTLPPDTLGIEVERLLEELERQTSVPLQEPVRQLRHQLEESHHSYALAWQRERTFEILVEHCPDVIGRIDRQLRHMYANPAIEQWTRTPPAAVVGKAPRELGVPEALCAMWQ